MTVDVRRILPHRHPFLMVDRFDGLDGDRFRCTKNVSHGEPHFVGHFPGEPVMPGVLIIEALAQAAAVALAVREGLDEGALGYLAGVDGARFKRKVVPGDVLVLEGVIVSFRRRICKVEATASVDGNLAAEAQLTFVYQG